MTDEKYGTHDNGKGRLYGFAEASEDSVVDRTSELHDHVEVYGSKILNCVIKGNAIISDAELTSCYIEGDVRIVGGLALHCQFYDTATMAEGSTAYYSRLLGCSRLFGRATLKWAAIRDASVYGDAYVHGNKERILALDGLYRVGTGEWVEAPRFHRFDDLQISITESNDGHAYIACKRRSLEDWLRKGPRIGRVHGWPEEAIERAAEIFTEWLEPA